MPPLHRPAAELCHNAWDGAFAYAASRLTAILGSPLSTVLSVALAFFKSIAGLLQVLPLARAMLPDTCAADMLCPLEPSPASGTGSQLRMSMSQHAAATILAVDPCLRQGRTQHAASASQFAVPGRHSGPHAQLARCGWAKHSSQSSSLAGRWPAKQRPAWWCFGGRLLRLQQSLARSLEPPQT